jgi:hypothetical protein
MTNPDLRTVREDDRLLDRLGRGEPVRGPVRGSSRGSARGDDVEAMLAAWRRSLPVARPADPRLLAAITRKPVPKRRLSRTSIGIAASFLLIGGGVTSAAAFAQPDSPLWPVTRFVYGDLADSRQALATATQVLAEARIAAEQGRYDEAARLLATAEALADKVDSGAADRLREEIAGLRDRLPAGTNIPAHAPDPSKPTKSVGVEPPLPSSADEPEGDPSAAPEPGGGPADDQDDQEDPTEDEPSRADDEPEDDEPEDAEPPTEKPNPGKGKPKGE